ncbi:hypothetical protein ABZS83_37885 [Streptomyces sp. NPDC005426]
MHFASTSGNTNRINLGDKQLSRAAAFVTATGDVQGGRLTR